MSRSLPFRASSTHGLIGTPEVWKGRHRVTQERGKEKEESELPDDVAGFMAVPENRQALLYSLAKTYPQDYLSFVRVNGQAVPAQAIDARFIASDKEWQE
jgi:hypothetical protein